MTHNSTFRNISLIGQTEIEKKIYTQLGSPTFGSLSPHERLLILDT